MSEPPSLPKLDRSSFSVRPLFEESDEKAYWATKTPAERLEALEQMRQILYGYDPASTRLQRVLTVAQRSSTNTRASGRNKDLADLENLP